MHHELFIDKTAQPNITSSQSFFLMDFGPAAFSGLTDPDRARARRNLVLKELAEEHVIDAATAALAARASRVRINASSSVAIASLCRPPRAQPAPLRSLSVPVV